MTQTTRITEEQELEPGLEPRLNVKERDIGRESLKAKPKEIDVKTLEGLEFPYGRSKILVQYKKYEYEYEDPIEARVFYKHFKPLALGQQKDRPRPITMEVQSISRLRHKGDEFLTYQVIYKSEDWRHNPVSFTPSTQGVFKIPRFRVDMDPNTNEIKAGSATIESLTTYWDIPFSKEKARELLDMFSEDMEPGPRNLTVVDSSGRRFSCSVDEFVNADFDDLVNLKTGFSEWMKEKEGKGKK